MNDWISSSAEGVKSLEVQGHPFPQQTCLFQLEFSDKKPRMSVIQHILKPQLKTIHHVALRSEGARVPVPTPIKRFKSHNVSPTFRTLYAKLPKLWDVWRSGSSGTLVVNKFLKNQTRGLKYIWTNLRNLLLLKCLYEEKC